MAKVFLKDFIINNSTTQIVAVTWQVALDKNFDVILDESIFDTENILMWEPNIKHRAIDKKYDTDDEAFARLKIYTMDAGVTNESDWFEAKLVNPTNGEKDITYEGKIISRIRDNKDGTYTTLY